MLILWQYILTATITRKQVFQMTGTWALLRSERRFPRNMSRLFRFTGFSGPDRRICNPQQNDPNDEEGISIINLYWWCEDSSVFLMKEMREKTLQGDPCYLIPVKESLLCDCQVPMWVSHSENSQYIDFFHSDFSWMSPIKQSQTLMVMPLTQSCLVTSKYHLLRPWKKTKLS